VVGWGQPLDIRFIVLVDNEVAGSEWEQELYRMGVPPEMDVYFLNVSTAIAELPRLRQDTRQGILLTGDIETMRQLVEAGGITSINLGGIHHRTGRTQRLRYVFLNNDEESALREIATLGVAVSAQDVPGARPVPLDDILAGVAS
jgi:PTS system mannose-specific IIB component/fructoselysine and glucoselysine-specific PTS system IIB component